MQTGFHFESAGEDVQRLDRIRFVTRYFGVLRGLSLKVPLGLVLLGLGFSDLHGRVPGFMPAVILGALCLMLITRFYYRRTFGEVEPRPESVAERSSPWSLIGVLVFFTPSLIQVYAPLPPAQSIYVIWSSAFFVFWTFYGRSRFQSYYLGLGFLLLGFAALCGPSAHVLPALVNPGIADLLCGAALILAGLLDHLQLVRTLRHPVTPQMEEPS